MPLTTLWTKVSTGTDTPARGGSSRAQHNVRWSPRSLPSALPLDGVVREHVVGLGIGLGPDVHQLAVQPLSQHRVFGGIDVLIRVLVSERTAPVAELDLAEHR